MIHFENLALSNKPFEHAFKQEFHDFLEGGKYILGRKLEMFEKHFALYCQTEECIGVANGLDALRLALEASDIEKGSEVIVPANTFIATILSVIHAGLKPVLVEPRLDTYTIDCDRVEEAITPKTKAIIPVHLYGKVCDMDGIEQVAQKYGLTVIEDCAQAHGATFNGRKAGSLGHYGAFSFYPVKLLGALGDGGAITCNASRSRKVRRLRNYGAEEKFLCQEIGYNSRLDELQAAMLLVKLGKLDEIIRHKKMLASLYFQNLKKEFVLPVQQMGLGDVFHLFVIRHPDREKLKMYLASKGIETAIHYPIPPYQQPSLKSLFEKVRFPISDEIHSTVLSLPLSYSHTESDIARVCEVMNAF